MTRTPPMPEPVRQPAEWQPHEACWVAWPSHEDLWQENLAPARAAFVTMARAIATGERLEVLAADADNLALARAALDGIDARFHAVPFGDIWLRDTAPIFTLAAGRLEAARFQFNGWGGKYVLPGDQEVGDRIAELAGVTPRPHDFVLDGEGVGLTTEQCLLNQNRNPGMSKQEYQRALAGALGIERLLWLRRGLHNDHTDGHVDTIARFVAPGVVVCMEARPGDPNREALGEILGDLRRMRLEVVTVPSAGAVVDDGGALMAASYVNYYLGNAVVVVPVYGGPADDAACAAIDGLFPGRTTVPVRAEAILTGGGAFHCITQQQPRVTREARRDPRLSGSAERGPEDSNE